MLYLLFYIDDDRYVIDAAKVVEVIPLVKLKKIPKSPDFVAGLFNYRGAPIPVIDLRRLSDCREIDSYMSTRIILVSYQPEGSHDKYILGMIAGRVTETIMRDSSEFIEPSINEIDNPYLAKVVTDEEGILQWVDVNRLVPKAVQNILFV